VSERENETPTAAEEDVRDEYEGWPRSDWAQDDEPAADATGQAEDEQEQQEEDADASEPAADAEEAEAGPLGHVVEADEAGIHTVEHVGGEIDVPSGYALIEGEPRGERRSVGIVVSRFNGGITNRLLQRALDALAEAGVSQEGITIMPVPGAFELPLGAMALAKTRRYACIVALGCVIRGETPHFDFVATEAASGLQLAAIETGVPVAFGVLTCNTVSQAEARVDRAAEAVQSALEMADAFAQLRASAKS
jgi:6,7-dimethyl-8-ribityllumazine synthase